MKELFLIAAPKNGRLFIVDDRAAVLSWLKKNEKEPFDRDEGLIYCYTFPELKQITDIKILIDGK